MSASLEAAPHYVRYDFVLTGYRYNYSPWQGLLGLFELHFETINIWTHLLGALYFLNQYPRMAQLLASTNAGTLDRLYYNGFWGCCVFQMVSSTVYHTWRSMGPEWERGLLFVDILGVAAQIIGSYATGLLNGFWCEPWLHGASGGGPCRWWWCQGGGGARGGGAAAAGGVRGSGCWLVEAGLLPLV